MKKILLAFAMVFSSTILFVQQTTYPVNGSYDTRPGMFAFTNATIVVNANQTLKNPISTIQAVGSGIAVPKGYVVVDLKGKFVYPSLVDPFTNYGVPEATVQSRGFGGGGGQRQSIFVSTKKGAYGWNESIRPETYVKSIFTVDSKKTYDLRKAALAWRGLKDTTMWNVLSPGDKQLYGEIAMYYTNKTHYDKRDSYCD